MDKFWLQEADGELRKQLIYKRATKSTVVFNCSETLPASTIVREFLRILHKLKMEFTFGLIAAFAALQLVSAGLAPLVLPTTTLLRTPQYDSAIIQSDRLGGSFAYSTIEGHSYQAVSPLVRAAYHPVEIRYNLNSVPLSYASPSYYVPNYAFSNVGQGQLVSSVRPNDTNEAGAPDETKQPENDDSVSVEST